MSAGLRLADLVYNFNHVIKQIKVNMSGWRKAVGAAMVDARTRSPWSI